MRQRELLVGNARIGAVLLDVLSAEGDSGARSRVLAALGAEGAHLRSEAWIKDATLQTLWKAGGVDAGRARRIGRELMAPGSLGLFFAYSGFATVEKAYRRCDQWLPREERSARYRCEHIESGRARVRFDPPDRSEEATPGPCGCAMRRGMLEGVPGLFGLLPARVREESCLRDGAPACVYDVRWSRQPRRGVVVGATLGATVAGFVTTASLSRIAPGLETALWVAACLAVVGLAGAAGRAFDLARQLAAVAGARRGQLALLEQADQELAERIDEMARVDSALASVEPERPAAAAAVDDPLAEQRELAARAADELRESTRALRTALGEIDEHARSGEPPAAAELERWLDATRCEIDRLESLRAGLGRAAREGAAPRRQRADLAAIVRGAIDRLREREPGAPLELEVEPELPRIACDAFQIEELTQQLVENALAASRESGSPVRLRIVASATRVELCVSDEGPGLDEELVDATFDPFGPEPRGGSGADLGLGAAYRIVREHGGELRVESRPGCGTRITAALPQD